MKRSRMPTTVSKLYPEVYQRRLQQYIRRAPVPHHPREWTDRDYSLVNCPYLDGIHNWFAVPTMDMTEEVYNENLLYNTYISAYNFKGFECRQWLSGLRAR